MAPPLIDTSIVPEVPGVLYALFDYGLTVRGLKVAEIDNVKRVSKTELDKFMKKHSK